MSDHLKTFLAALASSIRDNTFVKLTLATYRGPEASLRKVLIKPVSLAKGDQLCFVYRHATKDVTKNWPSAEGLALVQGLLGTDFLSAHLFTTANDIELTFDDKRRTRLRLAKATHTVPPSKEHNRPKKRPIAIQGTPYLTVQTNTGQFLNGIGLDQISVVRS